MYQMYEGKGKKKKKVNSKIRYALVTFEYDA